MSTVVSLAISLDTLARKNSNKNLVFCSLIRIFAAYNGTEPMPKVIGIKHNSLNINVLPPL
jgi:hypothetical protein